MDPRERYYEKLDQKDYDVKALYKTYGPSQRLARAEWFEQVAMAVVLLNVSWLGYAASQKAVSMTELRLWEQIVENVFCI